MSRWSRVFFAGMVAVIATACSDTTGTDGQVRNQNVVVSEPLTADLDASAQTRLRLEGINGNIDVVGVPGTDAFTVRGERQVGSESLADATAHLDDLEVIISQAGTEVLLRTIQPSQTRGRNYVVNYQLTVPDRLTARIINLNGNVTARGLDAQVSVSNLNGNVTLTEITGNGLVSLINGNIESRMTLPLNGVADLETINGNVNLDIPVTTSAALLASLTNGTISVTNLTLQNRSSTPNSLSGTLGTGQGDIDLKTVNGNIEVAGF